MLLIHTEQDCRTATSKPLHWQCTLLSSPLYTYGQECGESREEERRMHKAKNSVSLGEKFTKKEWHNAFFVFNIVLKLTNY